MPNYIRTTNPWLTAANAMGGVVDPLSQMMQRLPQIQMQMQHQADQMGIAQGHLDLQGQQLQAQIPHYQAQTAQAQAQAEAYQQKSAIDKMLLSLAPQARAAKFQGVMAEQGGVPGMPTLANAGITNHADLMGILAQALSLNPGAAQRAMADEQQPVKINQGQTGFSRGGMPMMQGMISAPLGNNVYAPQVAGAQPQMIQQGEFRPPSMSSRAPMDQLILDVARGIAQGKIDPGSPEQGAALGMTNMLGGASSPMQVPQMLGTSATNGIPGGAIEMLRKQPHLRGAFDQKYGQGTSSKVLGM